MLELVSDISEKVGKISSHKELESKPHLRRNNRIRSIHSSLKIEANSLSLSEVRDVINGHLVLGDQKEIQEVKNAYAAYEKISEIKPSGAFTEALKELVLIIISEQPAADVQEIVRCKDCMYFNQAKAICMNKNNRVFNTGKTVYRNNFCNYGAKKMDNE